MSQCSLTYTTRRYNNINSFKHDPIQFQKKQKNFGETSGCQKATRSEIRNEYRVHIDKFP